MSLLYLLDLIGTVAFAASGALAGVRREMDLFGVWVLGMVTAIGGGTLRDLLLGDLPPFCLRNEIYLWLPVAVASLVFITHRRLPKIERPLLYLDAIGLGTFVVIGTGKAIAFQTGPLGAVLMGVMTGTAGGVFRDILSNEVPLIMRREIYASACIFGGALLVMLQKLQLPDNLSLPSAAASVIILRLLSINYNWSLPKAN
ncbi:trimeric intracellular cation channel family protein [Malonomonas rubra]|uniref:trimeric intracellular cation channel family protein n=1 Tax=Malonomonas rubra TaxID=57040 RepID=UPI0026F07B59|nr:trimeric intracellular cation channel family protein [Malonomonas rubra]